MNRETRRAPGGEMEVLCNTRVLNAERPDGTQRYTLEVLRRLGGRVQGVAPSKPLHGVRGHLWEQVALRSRVGPRLLWSPANSGPLNVPNQVVTIHDVAVLDRPQWYSRRYATWYGFLLRALSKRVKGIITVSEFSRARISQVLGVPPGRITVTQLGVDEGFVRTSDESLARMRLELGLPSGRYILTLTSWDLRRNLHALFRAWSLVAPSLKQSTSLVVAGGTGQTSVFRKSGTSVPTGVVLLGHVSESWLPALYSGAEFFVFPSLYEGFGLPVLEAMAVGTPVLVSNAPALTEVVGEAGLVVDARDVDGLAACMVRLLDDDELRARLASAGSERARPFTWERTAGRTLEALEAAASANGIPSR